MIKCIVFDLDGTLVKSHETIYKATIKALKKLGLESNIEKEKFYNMLGHHFADIFDQCNTSVPDIEHFIKVFKGMYFDFIDDSKMYDNAFLLFEELKREGIKIGLLTTKGQDQAEIISNYFDFDKYLDAIEGRKKEYAIKPAPDQLLKICNELNIDPINTLMVGDTELDIECGKAAGAKTCAVSYGYRDVEKIKKLNPDYLIDDLREIINIIGGQDR